MEQALGAVIVSGVAIRGYMLLEQTLEQRSITIRIALLKKRHDTNAVQVHDIEPAHQQPKTMMDDKLALSRKKTNLGKRSVMPNSLEILRDFPYISDVLEGSAIR